MQRKYSKSGFFLTLIDICSKACKLSVIGISNGASFKNPLHRFTNLSVTDQHIRIPYSYNLRTGHAQQFIDIRCDEKIFRKCTPPPSPSFISRAGTASASNTSMRHPKPSSCLNTTRRFSRLSSQSMRTGKTKVSCDFKSCSCISLRHFVL